MRVFKFRGIVGVKVEKKMEFNLFVEKEIGSIIIGLKLTEYVEE